MITIILYALMACRNGLNPTIPPHNSSGTDTSSSDTDSDSSDTDESDSSEDTDNLLPAYVYLLAGQSNMAGLSQVTGLPDSQRISFPPVQIYWSLFPQWSDLSPSSPHSNGYSQFTGPEVSFGHQLQSEFPERQIFLIKHAVSGTNLAEFWYPGDIPSDPNQGEGYVTFIDTVQNGLSSLKEQGFNPEIKGMIWMQGESDACDLGFANSYQSNLLHFISRVREDVDSIEMPFTLGKIACDTFMCPYRDIVRMAQDRVAESEIVIRTIETEDLSRNHNDLWHYTGQSMRVLGIRFAQSLLEISESASPSPAVQLTGQWTFDYVGDYTVGWSFTVLSPITITDVGQLDIESDGLNHGTMVGIWDQNTLSLLQQSWVPAKSTADTSLLGHFRSVGTEPLVLAPGDYIIGLQSFEVDPDKYVHQAEYQLGDGLEYTGYRHAIGSVLQFPDQYGVEDEGGAWFGPNFWYTTN